MRYMQVKDGEWMILAKDQLKVLKRPEHDAMYRAWASGLLHSSAFSSRMAVKLSKGRVEQRFANSKVLARITEVAGQCVIPLTQADLAREAKIDRRNIGRVLHLLESRGLARISGRGKGNIRMYFYAKPTARLKERDQRQQQNSGIVITGNDNARVSPLLHGTCLSRSFEPVQGISLKIKLCLEREKEFVITDDDKKRLDDVITQGSQMSLQTGYI